MLTVIYQVCMCCFFLFFPLRVSPSIDLFSLLSLTAAHQVQQHNLLQSCTHHAFNQSFCCPAPNMCDVFPSAESWIKMKLNLQAPSNPLPSYAFCAFCLKRVVYVFVSGINDAVGLVFFFKISSRLRGWKLRRSWAPSCVSQTSTSRFLYCTVCLALMTSMWAMRISR